MKCPRCVQRIHRAAEACPHCGFSLADADARFGSAEVALRALTDEAGVLRQRERERVEEQMERMGRKFPQIFVAVYTGALGEVTMLRQFGFWLVNRAAFEDVPVEKPNEGCILLVLDPAAKSAGFTFGYRLDAFLDDDDTFDCLCSGHAHWLEGRHAEGIVKCLKRLEGILTKRCRQARRNPERFARRVQGPRVASDAIRPLRTRPKAGEESPSAAVPESAHAAPSGGGES